MRNSKKGTTFPGLMQKFFVERLIQQRNASPRTVASYRDTFRIFLQYAQQKLNKPPSKFELVDLDATLVLGFLNHLEVVRHNTARSRNARFAAIRSFFHYAALKEPSALDIIHNVLAIPMKRFERPMVGFLSKDEINALLNAPDSRTWCGQRDRTMFATLYNTGARVSELINMKVQDVVLDEIPSIRIHGKGRKERTVPLWRSTAAQIRRWLRQIESLPEKRLFPNRSGGPLSRTGVSDRLKLATKTAAVDFPRLKKQKVNPHLVRHTTANHLLQAGVDLTVIAIWLGHESVSTTHMYLEADLAMKERALISMKEPRVKSWRYRPSDEVIKFLEAL